MLKKVEKEQLKVPAHIDYLGDMRDFVTQVGKKHGFEDKLINAFKLSIDEAATNIMRHAYREKEGLITIRAIVKENSLTISIIDQGTYFDPKRVKDPDLNRYIDIGKKGGLGIFIMRKLMDDIDYRRTEEGNELRITKHRETPQKKNLVGTVSTIPLSIKAKFFFRTVLIITIAIAAGYLYYYQKVDDIVVSDFIFTATSTTTQINNRIASAPTQEFEFIEDLLHPIYLDYKDQIYSLTVADSTGIIAYSPSVGDLFRKYSRPKDFEKISPGIYKYALTNDSTYYEFEKQIIIKSTGRNYGKSHILISAESTEREIKANRMNDLKLAFVILAISYVGVALLIYLVMNPLRKLSEWIKDLGHGEIDDEIDIDASSEYGEIAQAFSDITQKFRDSQKSLVDQERLQKEMQVAQDIQQTLLPDEFPELEGYEIASHYEAAKEVGGDYYDFVEVDKDTLGIAVADVSGKGVPGSLVMTMIRTALRTEARGVKDAAEVLARVNDFVIDDIKKGMFVTVFYLILDSKKRQINYASAGHNPMILFRNSTEKTYYLNPKGFPIGIQLPQKDFFRKSIESETIQLTKDDILLIYTDGITEAMNAKRELFGEERLLKTLRTHGQLEVNKFVENLRNSIYSFTQGNQQNDDISFVAIKEKSTREEDELRRAKEAFKLIENGTSIREACETINLTTYAYYTKYKKVFEEQGVDAFAIDEEVSVEAKHLSIEEKTKIFDIISKHPEYGAGRIRDELNTETYNFTEISESNIYEELVRSRLNTRQLREAYLNKTKRSNRRLKPPGTPLMTLDGKIIIRRKEETDYSLDTTPEERFDKQKAEDASKVPEELTQTTSGTEDTASVEEEIGVELGSAKSDSDVEAESIFGEIVDVLAKVPEDENEDSRSASEEIITSEVTENETEAEMPDAFETHASIEELFHSTDVSNSDAEFENDELDTMQTDNSSLDSSLIDDDISFADFFGDNTQPQDEEFDEEDSEKITGDVASELQDDYTDDAVLSQTSEEDSTVSSSTEEFQSVNSKIEDNLSFADLIQAIDEEIVYVSEPRADNKLVDDNENGKDFENESDVEFKESEKERANSTVTPDVNKTVTEKERILVKGIKYYKKRDYDSAIREFKKVIEIYPDYKEAYSILGNAYFRNRMYDEAAQAYQLVKQIDPEDIPAHENMGVIYANRGEINLAIGEWRKVLELRPDRIDIENKIKKVLKMK